MTDLNIDIGNGDKPTRFQVNAVNHSLSNDKETYTKISDTDNHYEDDVVTELEDSTNIMNRKQARRKSSFRDKDKPPRFKDSQARFQVSPRSEDSDSDRDREALLDDNDTKYARSFRHFTREALPRLDNYRNMMSIQAAYRPTLDELHNYTLPNKAHGTLQGKNVGVSQEGVLKFGWLEGVLMRCLLNIWGVMLFLRLSWLTGQCGVIEGSVLILSQTTVTLITTLSMSAITTNGQIKGGGTYFMISRSLGPEFGGSIGLIFALANAVACAMYIVGFCESMTDVLKIFDVTITNSITNDIRVIGLITIVALTAIVIIGMAWESKAQFVLLCILLAAIVNFVIGSLLGPMSDEDRSKGFIGYNMTLLKSNLWSDYRVDDGTMHSYFSVYAIFFPAATGILAGANISGDLKDPSKAIPKGTIIAIGISTVTYIIMCIICGSTVSRNATGNVTDAINGSFAFMDCLPGECDYGLHNNFQVIELVSAFGPLIFAGCFAATLSSALASLVSAPKIFQALCKDELYPYIKWFAKGYGNNNEPIRGYALTFLISVCVILIGDLNLIAPLISNFFLGAYMLINFSTFHASLAKSVGWRPTFKYYNKWLSLFGAMLCVAVMFLMSWSTALITFVVIIGLYLYVSHRKPDVNWGSSQQAQTYRNALLSVQQLNNVEEHVKNYCPQILVLSGLPNTRPILVDFAYLLTRNISILIAGHVIKGFSSHKRNDYLHHRASDWFTRHKIKGFYSFIDSDDFESGARALMQASGIGKLRPNLILLGYKNNWQTCDRKELIQYFNTIHKALDMYLSVAILRLDKGLDYSQILGEEIPSHMYDTTTKPLPSNDSSADLLSDKNVYGSADSLGRTISQEKKTAATKRNKASSTSDLTSSFVSTRLHEVSDFPDPSDGGGKDNYLHLKKLKKNIDTSLYVNPIGGELPKDTLLELTQFTRKRNNAVIDVYWLYDDGGLTLLLPYIINTRRTWHSCKLRVFALANKRAEMEFELSSMASLLAKFRIDYSDLQLISDITKKPQESTKQFFNNLIQDFMINDDNENKEDVEGITESDLLAGKDKTNRNLRLREHLLQHSIHSDLVVMTLPMPRKNIVSAPLYMAWLECLSRGMPPFLFVRGNQQSVLTFYS